MADRFTAEKLAACDRVLLDRRATDLDFRVFYYLASATDRATGLAKRRQQTIADHLGVGRRSVQRCIDRLSDFGHAQAITKPGGSYVNAYRVVPEIAPIGSQSETKIATRETKIATEATQKGDPPFAPILPFKSLGLPTRARDAASEKALAALGGALARVIGHDNYAAWLRGATIADFSVDTITIEAPTGFKRDRIAANYEVHILNCCKSLGLRIRRVVVTNAKAAA